MLSLYTIAALLATTVTALPQQQPNSKTQGSSSTPLKNFYIVTTTQNTCNANSTLLTNVSALSFFAPFHNPVFNLRQQAPGYLSIPNFNLTTTGTLTTHNPNGFGQGDFLYGSQAVSNNTDLTFAQDGNGTGISIVSSGTGAGCLLQVNGSAEGWKLCPGQLRQIVVTYRGSAADCLPVYLQAVAEPPY